MTNAAKAMAPIIRRRTPQQRSMARSQPPSKFCLKTRALFRIFNILRQHLHLLEEIVFAGEARSFCLETGKMSNEWESCLKVVDDTVVRGRQLAAFPLGEGDVDAIVNPDAC